MPVQGPSGKPTTKRCSEAEKQRAVRAARQLRKELGADHGTVKRVAEQLGIGTESLRSWVKQAEIDDGVKPGVTSEEAARIKALEQENRELKRANEILRYAAKRRLIEPSARALRDAVMTQILLTLWVTNRKVYGAHKLWKAARRAGHDVGRDQVARLMRELGIEGVSRRRKKVFTTIGDPDAVRAPDLVNRNFRAAAPNQLWVTDLTYVPTRSGMAYVCFIVDAFSRRVVGWRVAANMKTDMFLDALEMEPVKTFV